MTAMRFVAVLFVGAAILCYHLGLRIYVWLCMSGRYPSLRKAVCVGSAAGCIASLLAAVATWMA